jgi:hypothetical protein
VAGEPLIDEGVVGVEQIDEAAIVADDRIKHHFRFAAERAAQVFIEVPGVGLHVLQLAEIEPLAGEVLDERVGALVSDHPLHLLRERLRIAQPALRRHLTQFLVRDAAPQEERQA